MSESSKIIETLDNVGVIHRIFPHLRHCNVAWMDIHDNGKVNLFGYHEEDFENTYTTESVYPQIDYPGHHTIIICDTAGEKHKHPVDQYYEWNFMATATIEIIFPTKRTNSNNSYIFVV